MATQVSGATCVCVMAKAPVPGLVKTRMCPPLSPAQAAAAAEAFLRDTWSVVQQCAGARAYLAWSGELARFPEPLASQAGFPQSGHGLGARIESVIAAGLADFDRVVVVGSDLPGLPGASLVDADLRLARADVVLGPSRDGGFYLIGARRYEPGMLEGVPWSASDTYRRCRERLAGRGVSVAEVGAFDDVDDLDGLRALAARIRAGSAYAPATRALLSEAPWPSLLSSRS